MSLPAGTKLGPYEIVSPLGAGGMGEVYRARDTRLGREVAVKVLPQHLSSYPEVRARFEREARTVSGLNHPHICTLHDVGRERGTDFLVMELLEGETLAARLQKGPLPLADVLRIGEQIADALDRAHRAGVMHRDLKPGNIMLTRSGAKLMDFGLARTSHLGTAGDLTSSGTVDGPLTAEGTLLGTMPYMAPEQLEGQEVDARADLWALGCVLHEMATGKRAFEGKGQASLITSIMGSAPAPISQLAPRTPPALEQLVGACLAKDPADRIQSAHDVKLQLHWLAAGGSQAGVPAPATRAAGGRGRRTWLAPIVVGALLLGAAAGYLVRGRMAPASTGVGDITYKPVTFEQGFVFAARFAPDGRTIVYSADWDRRERDVFVTSLDSPDFRAVGFTGSDFAAISQSGELAILLRSTVPSGNAYVRVGTLARASLTGGAPRAELEGVQYADIGADGASAVVRADERRVTIEYPAGRVLDEIPVVDGAPVITTSGYESAGFLNPRISPSGENVAFFDRRAGTDLTARIVDRSGKTVAKSPPFPDWWGLAWTPKGELWYGATEAGGVQTTLYGLDLRGRRRVIYRAPGALSLHDISQHGDVMASFDHVLWRVELVDANGGPPQDRSWREAGGLSAISVSHRVLISNLGDSGGPKNSVYIRQPNDTVPVRISDGVGMALSPDGSSALVVSNDTPPKVSIVPTGAGQQRVLDLGQVESVTWAGWQPNGSLVLELVRPGGKPAVYALSPDAKLDEVLSAGMRLSGDNLISPDGTRIVATGANGKLMLCTIATKSCAALPGARDDDDVAGWSADGRSLFIYQKQTASFQVERLDIQTAARSPWRTVTPIHPAVTGLARLIVSPDGTMAYSYALNRSELYVIKGLK